MAKNSTTQTEATSEKNVIPLYNGVFTVPSSPSEEPHLIGSRCNACGEHFLGRRNFCAHCSSEHMEQGVPLSSTGTLASYTIIHQAAPNVWGGVPYAIGWIDLPEGVRLTARLHRVELDSMEVGATVKLELATVAEDDENEYLNYVFVPA